jgi:DNA invertase Pin-like site-specific DNA recombinase
MRSRRPRHDPTPASTGRRRCAIYTRKSSEEGLEQSFNSLDAQREACEAYITSQRHEGWSLVRTAYDDGGLSGGTLDRPALQRLLADIRAGKVDLVVVYKADRLTRSLADFAKIVDVFDAHGASFVSVTQQFNTTTSMGRLTLNMLLSFAQFEREVTGERIRDKIAASKRKGMWMGGVVPLGYDVQDRKLVINPAEAETVQHIFRTYLALGTVHALQARLAAEGVRSKVRPNHTDQTDQTDRTDPSKVGGATLARGALYTLLQNPLYHGLVAHRGATYPGEHQAIIDTDLWEAVQARLADNRYERRIGKPAKVPSLLAGRLYDAAGDRLSPSHASKGGKRYRYYVSQALITGRRGRVSRETLARRIPADDIEGLVTTSLRCLLASPQDLLPLLRTTITGPDGAGQVQQLLGRSEHLVQRWDSLSPTEIREMLLRLLPRIVVHPEQIDLHVHLHDLPAVLRSEPASVRREFDTASIEAAAPNATPLPTYVITIPARLRRAGIEMALVVDGEQQPSRTDPALIRLVARAHALRDRLVLEDGVSADDFAAREGVTPSWVTRLARLAYLAPDIVAAILEGRQPVELTANRLLQDTRLPIDWSEQRARLGFG